LFSPQPFLASNPEKKKKFATLQYLTVGYKNKFEEKKFKSIFIYKIKKFTVKSINKTACVFHDLF